jgi:hypothetical protein
MTEKQKKIIRLRRGRGWTYARIAEALELSPNTVKAYCLRNDIGVMQTDGRGRPLRCGLCGKPLVHLPQRKPKQFCSDKCRYAFWNAYRELLRPGSLRRSVCAACGKEFDVYGGKEQKYCRHACYTEGRREREAHHEK